MKMGNEASILARHISSFLNEYVPTQKTGSVNTLKAYQDTIGLYLQFLEQKGISCRNLDASCFGKDRIGEWLGWLQTERDNQPETRNNRLASLRAFLKYLGHKETRFLYLYQDALEIERFRVKRKKCRASPGRQSKRFLPPQTSHPTWGGVTWRSC